MSYSKKIYKRKSRFSKGVLKMTERKMIKTETENVIRKYIECCGENILFDDYVELFECGDCGTVYDHLGEVIHYKCRMCDMTTAEIFRIHSNMHNLIIPLCKQCALNYIKDSKTQIALMEQQLLPEYKRKLEANEEIMKENDSND